MFRRRGWGLEVKTPAQIATMRRAGLVVAETLELLRSVVRVGMTGLELDRIAEDHIRACGAVPSFKGYHGFPGSICVSVNDEVVHGIPGDRPVREGDLVSLDCGAIVDGWHADAAITVGLAPVSEEAAGLMRVTEEALWRGLAAAAVGGRIGDISHAVEGHVRGRGGFGVVEDYVGHGIGSALHLPPDVPNRGRPGRGRRLVAGLALAVEPMVVLGGHATQVLADDWTAVTVDGSLAAHFEHTVALTSEGAWVLTALDGGQAALTALGVPYGGARVA